MSQQTPASPPPPTRQGPALLMLFYLHLVFMGLGLAASYSFPNWRDELSEEGGIVESLTAGLFALAFVAGVARFIIARPVRLWQVIWPILALVGFYDETSFAERQLGMEMPHVQGVKIDAVHDFIDVAFHYLRSRFRKETLLAVAFLLAGACCYIAWRQRSRIARILRDCPPMIFVGIAVMWVVPAVAIDLGVITNSMTAIVCEELFEMQAALALLFANLAITSRVRVTGSRSESTCRAAEQDV